jgi:O-methyltransferase
MNLEKIGAVVRKVIYMSGIKPSYYVDFINGLFKLGYWIKKYKNNSINFKNIFDFYKYINDRILENCPIDLFEFGVYKGDSLKKWLQINSNPQSRFFGFDSFSGLPEDWKHLGGKTPKGTFDVKGILPDIKDNRVRFVKGYFQDTLSDFLTKEYTIGNRIVIHCDADLYSSTLYVLATMHRLIIPGTIIIFDEFNSVIDEFRAFSDYISSFRRRFKLLASAEPFFTRVAIEIVE